MTGYIDGKKIPDLKYEDMVPSRKVAGMSIRAAPNVRYITTNGNITTVTLPARAAVGTLVSVVCERGGGWRIKPAPGQVVWNEGYPSDVTGYEIGDSANLVCIVADREWTLDSYNRVSSDAKLYGVRIDTTDPNPETAVVYTDDAVGFSPMRGNNGNFDWGSWEVPFRALGIRPCVLKNGVPNYYLNPDDVSQNANGSAADITSGNDGDVVAEFPKIYWKFGQDGIYRTVQISKVPRDGFVCLAHTRGDTEVDVIHIGRYQGVVADGRLRSLSGKTPTRSQTKDMFRGYAHQNGDGYEQFIFYQMVLLQVLYAIFFKNLDSQTALGRGNCDASVLKNTGARDKSGMFYGISTVGNNEQVVFCGIEDFYGNGWVWVDGIWTTVNTVPPRKLWIATGDLDTVPYVLVDTVWIDLDPRPNNYLEYGTGFAANQDGYVKDVHGTNETGFVTALPGGSETTHYCDYAYLRAGCVGSFGGHWTNAGNVGAFRFTLDYSPANVHSSIGGRLTHIGVKEEGAGGDT